MNKETEVSHLYDKFAGEFDRDRTRSLMEREYLAEFVDRLTPGSNVLDLGCGMGEPIARFLIEHKFVVTGIDAAPAMLELCRERFPDANWIEADMRGLDLGQRFAAVVAWDSFFHLTAEHQRGMFEVFGRHIAPGGLLLFTSGPLEDVRWGDLYGEPIHHASLAPDEYRRRLGENGFSVLRFDVENPNCGGHTVWLAQAA